MCNILKGRLLKKLLFLLLFFLGIHTFCATVEYVYDDNGNVKYAYNNDSKKDENDEDDEDDSDENDENDENDSNENNRNNEDRESHSNIDDDSYEEDDDSDSHNSNNNSSSEEDDNDDSDDSDESDGKEKSSEDDDNNSSEINNEEEEKKAKIQEEQNQINTESENLEAESNQLENSDKAISDAEDSENAKTTAENVEKTLEDKVAGQENTKKEKTSENVKKVNDKEKIKKELKAGDPVRIAEGYYEQSEIDIQVGNLPEVKLLRNYNSHSNIISSFGYGWTSNFDERIILGVDAGVDELEALFRDYKDGLLLNISNFQNSLLSLYNVSDINNAKDELNERIRLCSENLNQAENLCISLNGLIERIDNLISYEKTQSERQESIEGESSAGKKKSAGKAKNDNESLGSDWGYGGSSSVSGGFSSGGSSSVGTSSSTSSTTATSIGSGTSIDGNSNSSEGFGAFENVSGSAKGESDKGNNRPPENRIPLEVTKEKLLQQKVVFENQKTIIALKLAKLHHAFNRIDSDLELLSELNSKYTLIASKHEHFLNAKKMKESLKNRNNKALFPGMGDEYEETGFNTFTLIDEYGFPHVFYESENTGCWENYSEQKYIKCERFGNGFLIYEGDGSVKEFNDSGLIIKISDPCGHSINIHRAVNGEISYIDTSAGEKLVFEYNNHFVKKITNVRMSSMNAEYFYQGNKLVSVKDTDGDLVAMEYDNDGRMVTLRKSDGSVVNFLHEEQSVDGKVLTTATINEEGFAERFEYDRNRNCTVYINHDGDRTTYWYDKNHRTIREKRPDGSEIRNEYDFNGNLISVNENGSIIRYSYDSRGNKINASYSDSSFENWTYDNFNQVTSYVNRDGLRIEYVRDSVGNLLEYKINGKLNYSQIFDSKGQVTRRTDYGEKNIVTDFKYDDYGNLLEEKCGNIITSYSYDAANRIRKICIDGKQISEIKYSNHSVVEKKYNGLELTYLTNGRKDIHKIIQKDTVTNITHEVRIEYDKRHLPVRIYTGNGEKESLAESFIYTPEGKMKAEVLHGKESWVKVYEYEKGEVSEIKEFMTNIAMDGHENEAYLRQILKNSKSDFYTEKYKYELLNNNRKLLSITDGLGIKKLFEFDSFGNIEKITDGNGKIRHISYTKLGNVKRDESLYGGFYEYKYLDGRLISVGEENSIPEKADYFNNGSIKSLTDSYGKTTFYNYDNQGRVTSIKNQSKKIWYEYDNLDRVIKVVVGNSSDELSSIYYERFEYSNDERVVTITEGGKYKSIIELDAFGNTIKEIDGNNNERSFVYNCQNQLVESFDGYGNKTAFEYNALGEVNCIILPDDSQIIYKYNYFGLIEEITDACGTVYKASYDKTGRLIKECRRGDSENVFEYDNVGRIIKSLCANEITETCLYSHDNRSLIVKDGKGNEYIYNFDLFGRLLSEVNRKGDRQNFYYDSDGQLKSQLCFDGSTGTINYSDDRSILSVRYADGSENRFVYDAIGNILEVNNAYGSTQYRYDQGGRLIYQKDMVTGEEIYFEYDDAGNRIKLKSSNRETKYTYGKNNEIKEIFDNKQRVSIKLQYDKNGREVLRKFGNGTQEEILYDIAGRAIIKMQKSDRDEIFWAEAYLYGDDGKRTATVDNAGRVTLYEYNKKGQLENVYYPYRKEHEHNLKVEAEKNGLPSTTAVAENKYIPADIKSKLIPLMNSMQYGLAYNLTNLQIFIKESYTYDKNGNRKTKTTKLGSIDYDYDEENCLISSGSRGQVFVTYNYDKMGNLLSEESSVKSIKYAYNSQNRLIYCEVKDKSAKEYAQTCYAYDAFGRRVIVQDAGESAIRTLYDGFTFDVIKQNPIFENGMFTDSNSSGIQWTKSGKPTGDRYRYLGEDEVKDPNRYFYLGENTYKTINRRYKGERSQISVNGNFAAQTSYDCGTEYYSTDILGSVSSITDSYGNQKMTYSYDAFGSLVQGDLTGTTDFGYLGKQNDPTSHLYNYGYRDYKPETSRFTTVDPIRDGANWYSYCNGDPVNFVDLWGLFYYTGNGQESINDYSRTTVYIVRNDDGLGNEFNATRCIKKTDAYGNTTWYQDTVGANCRDKYYKKNFNTTTPDGIYYLTSKNLERQNDGTYNSKNYKNVLALATNDQNLTQQQRDTVNIGDRYFHANQKIKSEIYTDNKTPESAGCIIGKGGQAHQDEMMDFLMDGVDRPESIVVKIISLSNTGGCKK